jgi:hypothetical protein
MVLDDAAIGRAVTRFSEEVWRQNISTQQIMAGLAQAYRTNLERGGGNKRFAEVLRAVAGLIEEQPDPLDILKSAVERPKP